ncbi:uncharacterized protein BDR25DRAFT_316553 [Lindgomyces ingoldianus]|uniref:Uncharacterized protein n=1 Tax=Lindgomyces ingoldianus TaxID=673940 RepID=A0ACB6QP58_9PLEO|nr:uncharacterized protein BDR25DRAFT_316553 [Lindgomyces ingoldianus]KAF2467946.1 hypothetical protein BDR25DRAFT_316553 [Lindgomyces ingoldianus]
MKRTVAFEILSFLGLASAAVIPATAVPHSKTASSEGHPSKVVDRDFPEPRPTKVIETWIDGVLVKQCEHFSATGGSHTLGPCDDPEQEKKKEWHDWREYIPNQWCGPNFICPPYKPHKEGHSPETIGLHGPSME